MVLLAALAIVEEAQYLKEGVDFASSNMPVLSLHEQERSWLNSPQLDPASLTMSPHGKGDSLGYALGRLSNTHAICHEHMLALRPMRDPAFSNARTAFK